MNFASRTEKIARVHVTHTQIYIGNHYLNNWKGKRTGTLNAQSQENLIFSLSITRNWGLLTTKKFTWVYTLTKETILIYWIYGKKNNFDISYIYGNKTWHILFLFIKKFTWNN